MNHPTGATVIDQVDAFMYYARHLGVPEDCEEMRLGLEALLAPGPITDNNIMQLQVGGQPHATMVATLTRFFAARLCRNPASKQLPPSSCPSSASPDPSSTRRMSGKPWLSIS
jgi:hypothetical protein